MVAFYKYFILLWLQFLNTSIFFNFCDHYVFYVIYLSDLKK